MSANSNDKFWISPEHFEGSEELKEQSKNEFFSLPILNEVANTQEEEIEESPKASRRDFLKYLGFSVGAATVAAACDTPVRRAIPYVTKPDSIVPGVATYYASTFVKGGDFCSVLVKTREGRPIKIEGNLLSPLTQGATTARVQASVLELYDTSRYTGPGKLDDNGTLTPMRWDEIDELVNGQLNAGSNVGIVTNTILSPSSKAAIEEFTKAYPNTSVYTYDPYSSSALVSVHEKMSGERGVPNYDFSKAEAIVTIGADFLGTWIAPATFANQYAKNRKIKGSKPSMSYMAAVESSFSLTGTNADDRIQIKPSEQGVFIAALYNAIARAKGESSYSGISIPSHIKDNAEKLAKEVLSASSSLIVSDSNNVAEQELIAKINHMLGNYGTSIMPGTLFSRQGKDQDLKRLVDDAKSGSLDALFVVEEANPVYDTPYGEMLREALDKIKLKVSFSLVPNETTALCDYVCPSTHYLESWGDAQLTTTHYALLQPTIAPLFDSRQYQTSLLIWAGYRQGSSLTQGQTQDGESADMSKSKVYEVSFLDFMKKRWEENLFPLQNKFGTFQAFWDGTLHDGVCQLPNAADPISIVPELSGKAITKPSSSEIEVKFYEPVGVGTGQYANNPWLQEMPDPVTRVVWDNPVLIPVKWIAGGKKFEVTNNFKDDGDYADLKINGTSVTLPIVKQFGQPDHTVAVALGYGRTVCGNAGRGVGVQVSNQLSLDSDGNIQYFTTNADIAKGKGKDKKFASVQHHHTLGVTGEVEEGKIENVDEKTAMTLRLGDKMNFQGGLTNRTVIRQSNVDGLEEAVQHLKHEREHIAHLNETSIYPGFDDKYSTGHHWGLSIDLSACIGCGACQVACVAENNVPVVGKKEVHRHHEMTWLRIDRYYYGDANNPNVVYQPMMCQHCDNAPCENVCPVAATPHSSEGLNQMTYNRCVGTRYCANNCPYKVRRFNWLDYTTADTFFANENNPVDSDQPFYASNLTRMVLNPDVTVRSRGVIEKCSMCVQRIQEGKLRAKRENRRLMDGDIKTACQTACPTGAIIFGDMNDENGELAHRLNDDRTYYALEEVNVRPSVGYQMKVTNKKLYELHVHHGQDGAYSSSLNVENHGIESHEVKEDASHQNVHH